MFYDLKDKKPKNSGEHWEEHVRDEIKREEAEYEATSEKN